MVEPAGDRSHAQTVTDDLRDHLPGQVEVDRLLLDRQALGSATSPGCGESRRAHRGGQASGCRVVGITAPAGYGKSTLLSQWAQAEDRRVAWVSLNGFDDDPAGLLTLLASAYARVTPGHDDLVADMGGPGVSALGRSAPLLAAVLSTSQAPFVLMLDDLHELRSPACHDVLGVVISGIPRGSQLAAASRSEQPHVPRLRADGDAWELGASDLALDVDAAEQIFAQARVSIPRGEAAAVTERTEGWPAGLYLAAMIARASHGQGLTVSGDDRFVADYLYRESLSQLPESTQRFLRRTAVLDQLSAPLCDALLEEASSQDRLRELEASNSFLIPLDRRREWYRYHALFREFLLGELHRVEPDVVTTLHLRAADWYEANGSPVLALEHLLSTTTQRDRCVLLVTQLAIPTYKAGHMSTVRRWLSALGDPAIEAFPPLAVIAGWFAALTGQTAEAQRWAALLDAASFDPAPVDGHVVRLCAEDVAGRHVCRGSRADDERDEHRAGPGAALEPLARYRALPERRSASAHRGRRPGVCPVRGVFLGRSHELQCRLPGAQRVRARTRGDGSRAMGRGCWSVSNVPSPSSMSIACTTTPPVSSSSPWRRGTPCTAATWSRRTA